MRSVGEDDDPLERRDLRRDLLDQRHEGQVNEQRLVLSVIHDPGDLLREEARVQRVVDTTHAHDAVPGLKMARGVPRKGRDTISHLVALALEALGSLSRTKMNIAVGRAHDRTLDRARDDLTSAVLPCRMVKNLVAEQWPILHQTKHRVPPYTSLPPVFPDREPMSRESFPLAASKPPRSMLFLVNGWAQ